MTGRYSTGRYSPRASVGPLAHQHSSKGCQSDGMGSSQGCTAGQVLWLGGRQVHNFTIASSATETRRQLTCTTEKQHAKGFHMLGGPPSSKLVLLKQLWPHLLIRSTLIRMTTNIQTDNYKLARIWRNWNMHTLLVGLSPDTSAVENIRQVLKK